MKDWKDEIVIELKSEAANLPPNTRFHPIRKLMSRFSTSQRTIEQVMEELIAENVVVRRPGDGYFTRNLSPKRVLHYRLIYPKWPSESYRRLEENWRTYADKTGEFRFSSMTLDHPCEFFHGFPIYDCDALLVIPPAGPISRDGLRYICSLSIPVVIISHEVADIGLSMVSGNAPAGGAIAAAHLINNGHRRLAMLISEPHADGLDMRGQGFLEFARLSGISVEVIDSNIRSWESSSGLNYRALNGYLEQNGLNFSALFIISAYAAVEVYKVFSDRGISIPDDVSIVAHDDYPQANFMCPPLDCIDNSEIRSTAVVHAELKKVIEGKQPFFHIRQNPVLLVRQSVKKIPSPC